MCRSSSSWASTTSPSDVIEAFRERAGRAGVLLDFDGTLAPIVARPELAAPAAGARAALTALVPRFAVVAVVTGRRAEEVAALLSVSGIRYEGLYGLEASTPELLLTLLPPVEHAAAAVPEAWVEDKGVSIAVHYRQAPDPDRARMALLGALEPIAAEAGLSVVEGKMVVEIVPHDRPLKGGAVERVAGEVGLESVLYAGDDLADLEAFAALDRLRAGGLLSVKVAVRADETPRALVDAADRVVDGPDGLVSLLRELV
jgi:trehalose 6-phosphate phosphatase